MASSALMSLAYLAEISVVFNLAFGEFKSDKFAKEIDLKFAEITKLFPDGIDFSDQALGIENADPDFVNNKKTWLLKATEKFESIRLDRIKREDGYQPLTKFFSRTVAFATNPNNKKSMSFCFPFWKLPHGFLASWIYSKTEDWNYPFCKTSLYVWPLISLILLYIGFSDTVLLYLNNNICITSGYFLCGFLLTFTTSRPMAFLYAKFVLGKNCVAPRAKYYNFIITFLSTVALILIIYFNHSGIMSERIWYFLYGFFVASILAPLFMLVAHFLLDGSLDDWKEWATLKSKNLAQSTAKKTLEDLNIEPSE